MPPFASPQIGVYVPFAHWKPKSGFNAAAASMQTTVGGVKVSGKTWMFSKAKFLHEVFVLHSTITASVC